MGLSKLTLISLSDGINIEASRKSISDFKKYNGGEVIAINTCHSDEFARMCLDVGANVYTPVKKFGYPAFTKDQTEENFDFIYSVLLGPAMMADTEYVMFSDPDSVFVRTIDRNILQDADVIVPNDGTYNKVIWAFSPFWSAFGNNDDERLERIRMFFSDLTEACKKINIDFEKAASKDLRFCFMTNSIVKTERIRQFFTTERDAVKYLMYSIAELCDKHRPKSGIPEGLAIYATRFAPDQMLSMIFGLYTLAWKVNDNAHNCNPSAFKTEEELNYFLENNGNIEYIHSCKVYYNKKS